MSLEIEYQWPYERNEPANLQNLIRNYVRYNILSKCPQKIITSILKEHVKIFVPFSGEGEHQFDFRSKDKDIPWGIATTYHPPQVRNHDKKSEKDGYKNNKLD